MFQCFFPSTMKQGKQMTMPANFNQHYIQSQVRISTMTLIRLFTFIKILFYKSHKLT